MTQFPIPVDKLFCRVFELPIQYPSGFCHGGGRPVSLLMVDWFNLWVDHHPQPISQRDWELLQPKLEPFILQKNYINPGMRYLVLTDFDYAQVIQAPGKIGDGL